MPNIKKRVVLHLEGQEGVDAYPDILKENIPAEITKLIDGALQANGLFIYNDGTQVHIVSGDWDDIIGRNTSGDIEVGNDDYYTIIHGTALKFHDSFDGNDYDILTSKDLPKMRTALNNNDDACLAINLVKAFKLEDLEFRDINDNVDLSFFNFTPLKLHQLINKLVVQKIGERKKLKLGSNKDNLSPDDALLADNKGWDIL